MLRRVAAVHATLVKILIVDNDPGIRRLLASMLARLAPEIVECDDGARALAVYEAHRPDVVLMDIAMGAVDGISATAALTTAYPGIRVVVVTNYDDPYLREAATEAGACGYVLKENLLELPSLLRQLTRT
jgi:CheY-like chemotaxis protein